MNDPAPPRKKTKQNKEVRTAGQLVVSDALEGAHGLKDGAVANDDEAVVCGVVVWGYGSK